MEEIREVRLQRRMSPESERQATCCMASGSPSNEPSGATTSQPREAERMAPTGAADAAPQPKETVGSGGGDPFPGVAEGHGVHPVRVTRERPDLSPAVDVP